MNIHAICLKKLSDNHPWKGLKVKEILKCNAATGAVIRTIWLIGMIRKSVSITLVVLSLVVNKGYGQKDGHVVGKNGMLQVVLWVTIEATANTLKLNSV